MQICGIIAEYNPFHLGHAWQLSEARRRLGADTALVCAMSGNFVQRGGFALLDKYERAAMAAEGGADLVIELPLGAALSSAEGFAQGGVSLLRALGCTHLAFGAECPDPALLQRAASLRGALRPGLTAALREGESYAAAMQRAMEALDPAAGGLLRLPNNTLGVAYCAALEGTGIVPLPLARQGAGHGSGRPAGGFASASFLREEICAGRTGWERWMPPAAAKRLSAALAAGRAPFRAGHCDTALLAHLRRMDAEALRPFAPAEDGCRERLARAIGSGCTFREVCETARTRRFPLARIRRTLLRAYLGLPEGAMAEPQYIRVLALGKQGAAVLRGASLPVITRPAAERRLPGALQPALRQDALADALYALAAPSPEGRSAQARWRKTPFILRGE